MKKILLLLIISVVFVGGMSGCTRQETEKENQMNEDGETEDDLILRVIEGDKNYWITVEVTKLYFPAFDGIVTVPDEDGLFSIGDEVSVNLGNTVEATDVDGTMEKLHYKKKNGNWECVVEKGKNVSVKFREYGGGVQETEEGDYDYIEGRKLVAAE